MHPHWTGFRLQRDQSSFASERLHNLATSPCLAPSALSCQTRLYSFQRAQVFPTAQSVLHATSTFRGGTCRTSCSWSALSPAAASILHTGFWSGIATAQPFARAPSRV